MPDARDARRGIGVPGLLLVLGGAALVLVSFRYLDWYAAPKSADSVPRITFSRLHDNGDQVGAVVAKAYFDWLSWVLLIGVIAVGAVANAPSRIADALRVLGFLFGLVGTAATYYALAQYFDASGSKHNVLYHSTWGLWLALAGYLVAGIGAALGPRTSAALGPRTNAALDPRTKSAP
jgi:hypothetical protein